MLFILYINKIKKDKFWDWTTTLTSLTLTIRSSIVVAITTMIPMPVCSISTIPMAMPTTTMVSAWLCPYFDTSKILNKKDFYLI